MNLSDRYTMNGENFRDDFWQRKEDEIPNFKHVAQGADFDGWRSRMGGRFLSGGFDGWRQSALSALIDGLLGRSWELGQLSEEGAADAYKRIVVVGRNAELIEDLMALLRNQPPLVRSRQTVEHEGLFIRLCLPREEDEPTDATNLAVANADLGRDVDFGNVNWRKWSSTWAETPTAAESDAIDLCAQAQSVLYVFDAGSRWTYEDRRWLSRLRMSETPIIPVGLVRGDGVDTEHSVGRIEATLREQIGVRPTILFSGARPVPDAQSANPHTGNLDALLALIDRVLALRPQLAPVLALELPACRPMVVKRLIRRGALMAGLLGLEPIPLLDLPVHIAFHWRMATQVAAAYGRPRLDFRSSEMAGTLLLNLLMRLVAQQFLKFVPFVGWLFSGGMGYLSAWMLGHALVHYYEEEETMSLRYVAATVGGVIKKLGGQIGKKGSL